MSFTGVWDPCDPPVIPAVMARLVNSVPERGVSPLQVTQRVGGRFWPSALGDRVRRPRGVYVPIGKRRTHKASGRSQGNPAQVSMFPANLHGRIAGPVLPHFLPSTVETLVELQVAS